MASARAYTCVSMVLLLILSIVLSITIYALLSENEPQFYLHQLHVREDSSNSSNPNSNTTIFMDLEFKRHRAITPIRYNDVNITLSCASIYEGRRGYLRYIYEAVGYCVIPGFDTGKKKSVHREAVVVPRGPLWEDALRKIADGLTVNVRVDLSPKHMKTAAAAKAFLHIDRFGMVSKKPIQFDSGTTTRLFLIVLGFLLVIVVEILLLCCLCCGRSKSYNYNYGSDF